jgi:hypothetical protein
MAIDAQSYITEYLRKPESINREWLCREVDDGEIQICDLCMFAHLAGKTCDVCGALPNRAQEIMAEHSLDELFGDFFRGHRQIGDELSGLRTERVHALYNLIEGSREACVALSVKAALDALTEFWQQAQDRRAGKPRHVVTPTSVPSSLMLVDDLAAVPLRSAESPWPSNA